MQNGRANLPQNYVAVANEFFAYLERKTYNYNTADILWSEFSGLLSLNILLINHIRVFVPVEQKVSTKQRHERCITEIALICFEPLFFIDTSSMSYFDDVNNKLVIFNRVNNSIIALSNPISLLR